MSKPTADKVIKYAAKFVRPKPYKAPNMFTRWFYGNNTIAPYCAIFVYYCLAHTGGKELMSGCKNKAYCPSIWNWAKAKGYTVSKTSKAKKGDLVLFDWNKDQVCDHIGFILEDNGGTVKTLEGNTSNTNNSNGGCVQYRTRSKSVIKGYVRLPYAKGKKRYYTGKLPKLPKRSYFKEGDKGGEVKKLQKFLNWYGNYKLQIDGIYGVKTAAAVRRFQAAAPYSIQADGEYGKQTQAKAKLYLKH